MDNPIKFEMDEELQKLIQIFKKEHRIHTDAEAISKLLIMAIRANGGNISEDDKTHAFEVN